MSATTFDIQVAKKYGSVRVSHVHTDLGHKVYVVRLYETNVVVYNETTKELVLNTGGWKTPTTQRAINNALSQLQRFDHLKVSTTKGTWFIGNSIHSWTFIDGMAFKSGHGYVELA